MSFWILNFNLDLLGFTTAMFGAMALVCWWLRRNTGGQCFSTKAWLILGLVVAMGVILAAESGRAEALRLKHTISGLAPTYAGEMARGGLARIHADTAADDPLYLSLINRQIQWEADNPGIADIYTMTRREDGKFALLVDSETDYNRNGRIDDEREVRTPIGEVYEEDHDLLEQAFAGSAVFTPKPTTDRWGTWISTFVPVRDETGKVFAVLGVDFSASEYVHSILWHRGAMLGLGGVIGAILIGTLATLRTLRAEMGKRESLNLRLVEASRLAGMTEIATGVLHNVGNALNHVNVSAAVIAEKVRSAETLELTQAAGMLQAHQADLADYLTHDESGRHVPQYMAALAECVGAQRQELAREVERLSEGITHIIRIVQSQQEFAKSPMLIVQEARPAEVFEEALAMNQDSLGRHEIDVVKEFDDIPAVGFDKHRVLQVLVNLLNNAKQAVMEADGPRQIVLRLQMDNSSGGRPRLQWQVADSGVGIAEEHKNQIFRHGFTTRANGHGFGLHSSANAATEMGGSLTAESMGRGHGATFTLEIPIQIKQEASR